ncbi:hypothetical protein APY04_0176 [Hyphomicrobium sulfonivorans]|uniref:Uncharacterized protein n=1 Tax=Hyphomicrobium sulfonivorans TaxID=121290 RepID=A0A109BP51_HYPSL|nr:hypothetical protein APY04_0176 [Hyphomicrobium sulfonivorans]
MSGRQFEYLGYGRPPKVHPEIRKERERQRRQAAYARKQSAKGKAVNRRAA